jgi:hypothetical protein
MATVEHGFHFAWESLLLDFEEVLTGSGTAEPAAGSHSAPFFDRPFSIVKFFHHLSAETALELRADGASAVLSLFRHDPARDDDPSDNETEIGTVKVKYDEIIDMPDEVMARVYSLLPGDRQTGREGRN